MDKLDKIIYQWQTQGYESDKLKAMESIGRIKRLEILLAKMIHANLLKNFNLASWEFDVLATLKRSGEPYCLTPTTLFDTMMITSGGMTNRIQQLEKKLFIIRIENPNDKRSKLVQLSKKGLALIDQAVESHIELETVLMSHLSQDELDILNALLKKVDQSVENYLTSKK